MDGYLGTYEVLYLSTRAIILEKDHVPFPGSKLGDGDGFSGFCIRCKINLIWNLHDAAEQDLEFLELPPHPRMESAEIGIM